MVGVVMVAALGLPLAIAGWLVGARGGLWLWVGMALCLPYLLILLVLVDNAGDPPDAYPSTVFAIVAAVFTIFALMGAFVREYRMNKNGEVVR